MLGRAAPGVNLAGEILPRSKHFPGALVYNGRLPVDKLQENG